MNGFMIHTVEGGHVPAFVYHPATGLTPKLGMALKLSGGKLVLAAGADKPDYISMVEVESAIAEGEVIPVIAVTDDITFAVPASVAVTAAALGTKVTIATDGMRVTATGDGAAMIVAREGTAAGEIQYVRFA